MEQSVDTILSFKDIKGNPLKYNNKKIDENNCFLVLMLGARRAGKTSVLTAMRQCIQEVTANNNIIITPRDEEKNKFLNKKRDELIEFACNPKSKSNPDGKSGIVATSETDNYDFLLYNKKTPNNIYMIRFVDIMGEYIRENPNEVDKLLKRSDMVIIAIDSPAIMSNCQKIYEAANASSYINDYFYNLNSNDEKKRLVLFTPLKCEQYYWSDEDNNTNENMQRLARKIREIYKKAIDVMTNDENKEKFAVAITPILTIGGVRFLTYTMNENDDYVYDKSGMPEANYVKDNSREGYNPKYCEQPIFYLLRFLSNYVKASYTDNRLANFLVSRMKWLREQFSENNLRESLEQISRKTNMNENEGFYVISDETGYIK